MIRQHFQQCTKKKHNNLKICIEERYSLDKYSIALHTHKHIGTGTGTLAAGARQQWKERGRLGACMRQRQRRRRHTETWIDRERAREKEIYRPIYTNTCKHGNRGRMPFNKFFAVSRVWDSISSRRKSVWRSERERERQRKWTEKKRISQQQTYNACSLCM